MESVSTGMTRDTDAEVSKVTKPRYPSGVSGTLPDGFQDPRAWLAQANIAMDEAPIGATAPCGNPECCAPVDYIGRGPMLMYCSKRCASRAAELRARIEQQLDVLGRLLEALKGRHVGPKEHLVERERILRRWLSKVPPVEKD